MRFNRRSHWPPFPAGRLAWLQSLKWISHTSAKNPTGRAVYRTLSRSYLRVFQISFRGYRVNRGVDGLEFAHDPQNA